MAFVCLGLKDVHVLVTILAGAAVYACTLTAIGGIGKSDVKAILGRG